MNEITQGENFSVIVYRKPGENAVDRYLKRLRSKNSQRVQEQALSVIAEWLTGNPDPHVCNWALLRYEHTSEIRAKLIERYPSKNTVNRMLSALRGVLKEAYRLDQISAEDYHRAIDIENLKGETLPFGRDITPGEFSALIGVCENDPSPAGRRDAAIITVAYAALLRRSGVVVLDIEDYDPESGRLVVRGKGDKQRTAYLLNGASKHLNDWLQIRGDSPGPLFYPVNKAGKLIPKRMTTQAVYIILEKRGEQAKIDKFTPHDLRRSVIGDLLDAGVDISTVAQMAGHASVTTTARYDRRPEEVKKNAANKLHIPYSGKREV